MLLWWMVLTECCFFLSPVVTFWQVTLSVTWQNAPTAPSFHTKDLWYTASPISFGPFIVSRSLIWYWIMDSLLRNAQWSVNIEISISIIKHVQIIITAIFMFCLWVATYPTTFTSTGDSSWEEAMWSLEYICPSEMVVGMGSCEVNINWWCCVIDPLRCN